MHPLSTSNHNKSFLGCSLIFVVLHPLSTSNHNSDRARMKSLLVVLHPLSTSNHNIRSLVSISQRVVLHPLSTSNHNPKSHVSLNNLLYCILFLHQTTTRLLVGLLLIRCIASSFYIKPQRWFDWFVGWFCCIASSFYIKPQHRGKCSKQRKVVLHPLSTSNHNSSFGGSSSDSLYCILFLHQTTTISI